MALKFIQLIKAMFFPLASSHVRTCTVHRHSSMVSKRDYDRLMVDALLEPLLAVSDSCLIDESFDGLLESRSSDTHQDDFIERALHLGSVILEAGKRFARKRSTVHNTSVFSMLDTRSTCTAAATCLFFQKCAIDPLCYTNIDLASLPPKINVPKFNKDVASTMIERAGKALQSIKLGEVSPDSISYERYGRKKSCIVSCLSSLNANGGALGPHLRRLHLYNIHTMDETELSAAVSASLSVCPSLVELKFENMIVPICRVLESVSRYCRLLERFIVEFDGGANYDLESSVFKEFVLNCPKITALALQSCGGLLDPLAFELVKGFHDLKYVDFAGCHELTGAFLENLVTKGGASSLEVMILRELQCLDEVAIKNFMEALLAREFRLLRHIDISESGDLIYNDEDRYVGYYYDDDEIGIPYAVSFFDIPVKKLLQHRPNFCMVVESN